MTRTLTAIFLAQVLALSGCGGGDEADEQPDGSADTDTDTDTDTDAGADAGALCEDPLDVMQPSPDGGAEIPTGIEECADGSKHRYAAIACTDVAVNDGCTETGCGDGCPPGQMCHGNGFSDCICITPCSSDSDCATGEACLCEQDLVWFTHCVPALCRVDADCGLFECGVDIAYCMGDRLACRTEADMCHGDLQCPGNDECRFVDDSSRWECVDGTDECD